MTFEDRADASDCIHALDGSVSFFDKYFCNISLSLFHLFIIDLLLLNMFDFIYQHSQLSGGAS